MFNHTFVTYTFLSYWKTLLAVGVFMLDFSEIDIRKGNTACGFYSYRCELLLYFIRKSMQNESKNMNSWEVRVVTWQLERNYTNVRDPSGLDDWLVFTSLITDAVLLIVICKHEVCERAFFKIEHLSLKQKYRVPWES